ncbi:glycine cleavage H-protein-domain-containing protein [Crepidotus variabilis]|uniref:Glycine cleavage system H protein n=1 Tax=Crepidotus variabilis TaxID=179855 RepID=A0A9P6JT57_9AGAR|nr:glycine cleavage H-protein-domain-containing protein [Crepidotus variabilis]
MQTGLRTALRSSRFAALSIRHRAGPSTSSLLRSSPFQFRSVHNFVHKYTPEHELVKFDKETGIGIVSITDHAQSSLGDVVFVELPSIGTEIKKGETIGAVESVKAASDIYAPVSGTVEEINETLADQPGLLNKSPEDKGWLCKIKLSDPSELDKLLTHEDYEASYES